MFDDYIALDVETASGTPSICSIGIVHVINGKVEERYYRLINPQKDFDYGTIAVHGITPDMVRDAPVFSQVWEEIRHFFVGNIVVAHNATFDLSQLAYSLQEAGIFIPAFYYLDTVTLARKALPGMDSYSLGKISYQLALPSFDHHNALADAEASQTLLERVKRIMPLHLHQLRRYSIYRESRSLKLEEFLSALRLRELLSSFQTGSFLSDSEKLTLEKEISKISSENHLALKEFAHLTEEILAEGYVFSSLHPRLELLWNAFFPSSGHKGFFQSLQVFAEYQDSSEMSLSHLQPWIDYHTVLHEDPLLYPFFSHLQEDPFSSTSLDTLRFLISPFDPWESIEGKVIATCGKFRGGSAAKFLDSLKEEFEVARSFNRRVDVLIVGSRHLNFEGVLREAIRYRQTNKNFRIFLQPEE